MVEIKIGETVRLKSGGPVMTIHSILGQSPSIPNEELYRKNGYTDGDPVCTWFDGSIRKEDCFRKEEVGEPFFVA